jgi:hypothetical protein
MNSNYFVKNHNFGEKKLPHNLPPPYCYSDTKTSHNPYFTNKDGRSSIRRFGYQPVLKNPGGVQFYSHYYPYQSQSGKPLNSSGSGWYNYQKTGSYDSWW